MDERFGADEAGGLDAVGLTAEAVRLGVAVRTARRLAHRGALGPIRLVGGTLVVRAGAMEGYLARRAGKAEARGDVQQAE